MILVLIEKIKIENQLNYCLIVCVFANRRTMYKELTKLYPTHACKEHNHNFPLFVENCGYS